MSESGFFNPYEPIWIHERKLPHWQQSGALYFLTWRLADSIPVDLMREWIAERKAWIDRNPVPLSSAQERDYRRRFPARIEALLDQGMGSCALRRRKCRRPLMDALSARGDADWRVDSFVIMPNHVHAVVQLDGAKGLPDRVKRIKGGTAREINRVLGRQGAFWQAGYWDRIVRDSEHLYRCRRYIANNPVKAGLDEDEHALRLPEGWNTRC